MTTYTYRRLAFDGVVQAAYESIGGSPWQDDVESAMDGLRAKLYAAIDADELLREIFNRPMPVAAPSSFLTLSGNLESA
ncbi:hypothetical protein BH10PSE7_BH10PSE7_34060 [soil metagenome]